MQHDAAAVPSQRTLVAWGRELIYVRTLPLETMHAARQSSRLRSARLSTATNTHTPLQKRTFELSRENTLISFLPIHTEYI